MISSISVIDDDRLGVTFFLHTVLAIATAILVWLNICTVRLFLDLSAEDPTKNLLHTTLVSVKSYEMKYMIYNKARCLFVEQLRSYYGLSISEMVPK